MDTRRLRYFVAVVDHGGFTAAAKATYVSQPALSLAVKELEADLGAALFDRIGRRVQLTAAGTALLGPARQVLRDIETGRAAVSAVAAWSQASCHWRAFRPWPLTPRRHSSVGSVVTIRAFASTSPLPRTLANCPNWSRPG